MKEVEEQRQKIRKEREEVVIAATDLVNSLPPRPGEVTNTTEKTENEMKSIVGLDPEAAYNPSKSMYDTLSCETFERMVEKKESDKNRGQKIQEQRKLDQETFGSSGVNRFRYSHSYSYRSFKRYGNAPREGNHSDPNHSNLQKKTQKVFRPVQREGKEGSEAGTGFKKPESAPTSGDAKE